MLELLKQTKIAHKAKFIVACILWLAVCLASVFLVDNVYLSAVGTFFIGLFAYWQLDAPKSKSGEDVVGLLIVAGSVFLGMLLSMGLSAFLAGGMSEAMETTLIALITVVVIVAIGVGAAYFVLGRQNAPKLSEEAWRKRLCRASVLKSWARDVWAVAIVAVVVLLIDLFDVLPVELGAVDWILLACVDAIGGMFLMIAGILMEKLVGANLAEAFMRGEQLSDEEISIIQWEQARTAQAQQAKLEMDATKATSSGLDDIVMAASGASRMHAWSRRSDRVPLVIRHLALIVNILVVIVAFCL